MSEFHIKISFAEFCLPPPDAGEFEEEGELLLLDFLGQDVAEEEAG